MSSKINWLIQNTEAGSIILQSWLTQHDISPALANKYVQSNWLKKLRAGVYVRIGREPTWLDALYCLQTQLNLEVHLAGLSSLNHQGYAHYLPSLQQKIWLNIPQKQHLPAWFTEFPNSNWLLISTGKLITADKNWCKLIQVNHRSITTSMSELAIYELLNEVPNSISFEFAAEIFQGMVNISPRKINEILTASEAIKTNRLFLFLNEYYAHSWSSRIEINNIKQGTGKRQIVQGGKFDTKYQITVPAGFIERML